MAATFTGAGEVPPAQPGVPGPSGKPPSAVDRLPPGRVVRTAGHRFGSVGRAEGAVPVAPVGAPAIAASIQSGDFDLDQRGLAGDGEFMMKIRRVIPDFLQQTGAARVTLNLKNYPTDTEASSSLGPFEVDSDTTKIDTRARARAIALKIDNTSITQHWKLGTFRLDIQPDGRR